MNKIIKGDQVVVVAGKDSGKQGRVIRVLGNNIVKRHQKPNSMRNIEGGIIIKEMPIAISNVAILNPNTKKADRVGIKMVFVDSKVKRVRVFKSDGMEIPAVNRGA